MANLKVEIDVVTRFAVFSGPGTFQAKDQIKALGQARWNSSSKHWEVSDLEISSERLQELFPGILVTQSQDESNDLLPGNPLQAISKEPDCPDSLPLLENQDSYEVAPTKGGLDGLSVSSFIGKMRELVQAAFPAVLCIFGRITKVKRNRTSVYIELSDLDDPSNYLTCAIWGKEEAILRPLYDAGFSLEKDMQVMFKVKPGVNAKDARVLLRVVGVVAEYTVQRLAALRELTNKRLQQEGLFGANAQLKFPFCPLRIGVLTSASGTVINDFLAGIEPAEFQFDIRFLSVNVQGSSAVREIVAGLEFFSKKLPLDIILLFRGGGSPSELAIFNDYQLAKAICCCPIPVLSAVGHQADQSSAQDVSYRSFGVPKDLGRFLAETIIELRQRFVAAANAVVQRGGECSSLNDERLRANSRHLGDMVSQYLRGRKELFSSVSQRLPGQAAAQLPITRQNLLERAASVIAYSNATRQRAEDNSGALARVLIERQQEAAARGRELLRGEVRLLGSEYSRRVGLLAEQLGAQAVLSERVGRCLERAQLAVEAQSRMLETASPAEQLKRGYAIVRDVDTKTALSRAASIGPGQQLMIEFFDGQRRAIAEDEA